MRQVVIVSAARTPIGSFQGALASKKAPELGAVAIKEALSRARVQGAEVSEVIMGCVLPAAIGQAPARQASIFAGVPKDVPCMTINKVCGSGLKAVMLGAQAIALGDADVVVAGGMESMSNVPYYLPLARTGYRMGNGNLVDGMIHDGLWDPYNDFHMGMAAELCARERQIDRSAQDAYAAESFRRAQDSVARGLFAKEIVPVEIAAKKGPPTLVSTDEQPARGDIAKLPSLKAAFQKDGTVTAGNASSINDGAAAVVLMSAEEAARRDLQPLGRIAGYAQHAQAPEWFTTAPAYAIEKALRRTGLTTADIDLYEVNEAFAVVAIANNQILGITPDRVNVRGGAIALGHPIGASGARVLATLLYAMADGGARRGVASLCIGGGEGVALIVER